MIQLGNFIAIVGLLITALIAMWSIHIKSNEQAAKLKELEIKISHNEEKIAADKIRITKLEDRDDVVVEVRTELKHLSKRFDELLETVGGKK